MNQAEFIRKDTEREIAEDFKALRTQGIRRIQELTGNYWTDFNLHDPGVTILEQLCYAITDLGYRTSADIEKHIFSSPDQKVPFFKPEDILTNAPITLDDLRKVFIDAIPEVRNLWIEPASLEESGFNGLYNIQVDVANQELQSQNRSTDLKQVVQEVFSQHRNIGEDIHSISLLEELPIQLEANIETNGLHEMEKILAEIYFKVEQSLAPEVKFYSLQELIEKGLSYAEIFNGPRLKHGFILSEDLQPKKQLVAVADIVRGIMEIEGIASVKHLSIAIEGQKYNAQFSIPAHKVPRVITQNIIKGNTDFENKIRFFKGSLEYTGINLQAFVRYLNELVSVNKKNYRISESSFEIPKNQHNIDFEPYYSIQEHFPGIYGIGRDGIPGKPDIKRKAQAKQLKAYLMLFEQIMANYLSQLAHFKDLLSIHQKQDKTYFTQPLTQVPHADDLFRKEQGKLKDAYLDLEKVSANYAEGLGELNQLFDNFIDRRNRFLDYLLALHGEKFTQHSLKQFDPYHEAREFEEFIILCKTALLQHIGSLNYERASGLHYLSASKALPSFMQRMAISLGIGITENEDGKVEVAAPKSFFEGFKKHKVQLKERTATELYAQWADKRAPETFDLSTKDINQKFDLIDDIDLKDIDLSPEMIKTFKKELWPFQAKTITKEFLADVIRLDHYKIGTYKRKAYLLFKAPAAEQWLVMGSFNNEYDAHVGVKVLLHTFKQINREAEGISLVEHILLRPDIEQRMFGIYINDQQGKAVLKSSKQYNIAERDAILKQVEEAFHAKDAFYVEADNNREMRIVFQVPKAELSFESIQANISVEETHQQKEELIAYLTQPNTAESAAAKFGFYIQYAENMVDIPESFFSFQVSILFPDWSARFQSEEFREVAKDVINENKPANIVANIGWLSTEEVKPLDGYRENWLKSMQNPGTKDYQAAGALAEFLYKKVYQR